MLSPNPLSLFCAVLLCLPLALVFTISGDPSSSAAEPTGVTVPPPITHPTTTNPHDSAVPIILPTPQNPPKSDDDEPLLRAASKVSSKPSPPPKKVAFMFLTTTPLPFAPIWESFFRLAPRNRFNVYVHADPSFHYHPPFSGVFSSRVIPSSRPTRRNTPTLASAARRLLAHALLHDPANYMFALLSSSCVPLHSFGFTYGTLAGSRRSFIEVLGNETTAYERWAARGEEAMLPEVGLDEFRIGSQFWALTRKHARAVVRDRKLWGKFRLPCVRTETCYPEENYFPTLLSMVDPRGLVPATLTHVDWRGRYDGHPRTYNASEVGGELIRRLRGERPRYGELLQQQSQRTNGSQERWDPFLFARKFEPECLEPLLSVADEAIFKD